VTTIFKAQYYFKARAVTFKNSATA